MLQCPSSLCVAFIHLRSPALPFHSLIPVSSLMYMYHSGEAIFKIWSFLPHNYFFLLLGAICAGVMEAAQSWPFISPAVARPLFPGVYLFNGLGNEGYISLWGKAGHMSISLGADRITLLLSVCATNQPIPPQRIRPDIPVSALPYASQAHLRHICAYYICLFSAATMPSPISECSLFAFVATTGSYFHLFIQARDLSTRPSRDERRR